MPFEAIRIISKSQRRSALFATLCLCLADLTLSVSYASANDSNALLLDIFQDEITPDLRPFYQALQEGDTARAEILLAQLKNNFPAWQPPADLLEALSEAKIGTRLNEAHSQENWQEILKLEQDDPNFFSCPFADRVRILADAYYATNNLDRAMDQYRHIIRSCRDDQERLFAIDLTSGRIGIREALGLLDVERNRRSSAEHQQALIDIERRLSTNLIEELIKNNDLQTAIEMAEIRQNGQAALLAAWALFNQGTLPAAQSGFKTARSYSGNDSAAHIDATYGLGLIALRERDLTNARRFTDEIPETDTRRADLIARLDLLALPTDLSTISEADLIKLIEKNQSASAAITLGWRLFNSKEFSRAAAVFQQAESLGGGDPARVGLATTLIEQNDIATAERVLNRIELPPTETAALNQQLEIVSAWAALNSGNLTEARNLAKNILNTVPEQKDTAQEILARIDLKEAETAFNAGDLNQSISLATDASTHPKVRWDAKRLIAGAQFQLRQFENAAQSYLDLYREEPNAELLEPLYNSLINSYGLSEANVRISALGSAAQKSLASLRSELLADQSLFFAAHHIAPERWTDLDGIEKPWIQLGARFRATNGDAGFDRYRENSYQAAARFVEGRNRFTLSLDFTNVSIGSPTVGEQIAPLLPTLGNLQISSLPSTVAGGLTALAGGDASLTLNTLSQSAQSSLQLEDLTGLVNQPTTNLNGFIPRLSWTREGFWQPFASIGLTPINGEVSALPIGEIGVTRYLSTGTQITGRVYAQNRTDSLLSLSGNIDPFTGEDFGRAIEVGGEISALIPISPRWTVSTSAAAAAIVGDDIDTNQRYRAQIGISRNINLNDFKYFAIGPSVQFETNSDNQDFFTLGNGGYFSPQVFVRAAANLNFQTKERYRFIIRGSASIAFEYIETDDRDILPSSIINAGQFLGSNNTGIAGNALVEGIYRLSDRWALGGYAGGAAANDFYEAIGGVYLRFIFGKRDALVSTDLFPPQLGFSQR